MVADIIELSAEEIYKEKENRFMILGEAIKQARINKNISQEELAHRIGVSRQAVSKWENGSSIPHGVNRDLLREILELDNILADTETPIENEKLRDKLRICAVIIGVLVCALIILVGTFIYKDISAEQSRKGAVPDISENFDFTDANSVGKEDVITSILFCDTYGNVVSDEALWYNMYQADYVVVSWDGDIPETIEIYTIPAGSNTMEEKELVLTKVIQRERSAALISLETLKQKDISAHLFISLNYGEHAVVSDGYNIFYDDSEIAKTEAESLDVIITEISDTEISYDKVEWIHKTESDTLSALGVSSDDIAGRYFISNDAAVIERLPMDESCTFTIVEHETGNEEVISCTREEFIDVIRQRLANQESYAYILCVRNQKIVSIDER